MLARFFIVILRLYQRLLSPLLGNVCRFEPSCSRYAVACLERFGAARGSWLTVVRLCKCHPFHPGGYDPPPGLAGPVHSVGPVRSSMASASLADRPRGACGSGSIAPEPR